MRKYFLQRKLIGIVFERPKDKEKEAFIYWDSDEK
jgi:hypothetical protein